MEIYDDDLSRFEADGAAPLPITQDQGYVENDGARIWYAAYGSGSPVILLHGGLGNSGNWGYQIPALLGSGYRAVVIDSRGHGRSTRDARPYSYELMASDVSAVMKELRLEKAALVGWSDGACTALILAAMLQACSSLHATWTRAVQRNLYSHRLSGAVSTGISGTTHGSRPRRTSSTSSPRRSVLCRERSLIIRRTIWVRSACRS